MNRVKQWFLNLHRPTRWIVAVSVLAVLVLAAITVSATAWEYTNSPEFCGTTCHTMPPEYAAYQVSPHARVDCVDCHLGQDSFLLTLPRKAREVRHVINALTQAYEPPIYVKSLRPARDTCEQCHNPDKFSSDTFVELKRYGTDEENELTRTYLIIKTGGGTRREGLGRGIHWHVENQVEFYATDPLKQDIPYVRAEYPDGEVVEYFDVEADLPPDFSEQVGEELHEMDCIDCHTRISHLFRSPSRAMDRALALHQIDNSIPFIKERGVEVLNQEFSSVDEGLEAVATLDGWYQENYPDFYGENQAAVQEAVEQIQALFTATVFPNMGVGWETHPDNSGHQEFPGCFRCHDGKHVSPEGETIRLECNICHSIPEVVQAGMEAPVISIDKPGEPESHKDSNWLARHRYEFDGSCAACHDVSNPGGTDNSSFCANSACHATEWKFVGLDAPAIRAMVEPPDVPGSGQPEPVPHPIGPETDCLICHSAGAVHPFPENHAEYTVDMCTQCHEASLVEDGIAGEGEGVTEEEPAEAEAGQEEPAAEAEADQEEGAVGEEPAAEEAQSAGPGPIPHPVEGREDCLACHDLDGMVPFPEDHEGRAVSTCQACHEPEEAGTDDEAGQEEPAAEEGAQAGEEERRSGRVFIPHPVEGREACLTCHGADGTVPVPESHEGRRVTTCQACHKPLEE